VKDKKNTSYFIFYPYVYLYLDDKSKPYTTNMKDERFIQLITILDYFTCDEIINSFLHNINLCGIVCKNIYADGRLLTPFEFLEHDIVHSGNYQGFCYRQNNITRKDLKSFYDFFDKKEWTKEKKYSVKFLFFLLIHESYCDFFPSVDSIMTNMDETYIFNEITNTGLLYMNRYLNENDLGKLIPTRYRRDETKVTEFLKYSIDNYLDVLREWTAIKRI